MKTSAEIEDRWRRRLEREKSARQQAEKLLEEKSGQLYLANKELERLLQAQGRLLENYRHAMVRLTDVLLTLGGDHEANIERLLAEGGMLLGAVGARVVRFDGETAEELWTGSWRDAEAVTDEVMERALESRRIERWQSGGEAFLAVPLDIRLRHAGVLAFALGERSGLEDLEKVIAELVGSGVAGELEREEAGRAMRANEERYETLFHASVDAILIIDFRGRIREASDSALRMFGLSRGWLLRTRVTRLVTKRSAKTAFDAFHAVKRTGRCHYEAELLRDDGSSFPAEVVGQSFEVGGQKRIYGIVRDITLRKENELAVIERERKFRAVFERSLDGIVLHDLRGRIVDANETLCKLLGWSREDLRVMTMPDLHPVSEVESCRAAMGEVVASGSHRFECQFQRRDGQRFTAEVWANRFDLGGEPMVQGIVRDVTEERRAEAELRSAMESAELANEAKSVFLATMSHEIRTPLNGILGFTDLLERAGLDESHQRSLRMIRKSGDVLLGLINNILDFSRAESGRLELKDVAFDPKRFLRNTVAMQEGLAGKKGLKLSVRVGDEVPPRIVAPKKELQQVVTNLVGNAVKFTEEGMVRVTLSAPDERLRLIVEDSGPGFPAGDAERLFEAFYQVDLSSTRKHGGTGLGLAISLRFVREMGGTIRAENRDEGGARFVVDLPLRRAEESSKVAGPRSEKREPSLSGGGARVLVVEDHPINSRLLGLLLEELDFHAEVAMNGREALDKLAEDAGYRFVLMDMRMPVMDGLEATRRLRAGEAGEAARGLPVVAVTANVSEADREECHAVGMDHYLSKPIDRAELERVLREVMEESRSG